MGVRPSGARGIVPKTELGANPLKVCAQFILFRPLSRAAGSSTGCCLVGSYKVAGCRLAGALILDDFVRNLLTLIESSQA